VIRVTVELIHSITSEVTHLGTAKICNLGTSADKHWVGNYSAVLSKWKSPGAKWKTGDVEGFPRQAYGPWDLLYVSLTAALGPRRIAQLNRKMAEIKEKEDANDNSGDGTS